LTRIILLCFSSNTIPKIVFKVIEEEYVTIRSNYFCILRHVLKCSIVTIYVTGCASTSSFTFYINTVSVLQAKTRATATNVQVLEMYVSSEEALILTVGWTHKSRSVTIRVGIKPFLSPVAGAAATK
jgi:hypothetical protein